MAVSRHRSRRTVQRPARRSPRVEPTASESGLDTAKRLTRARMRLTWELAEAGGSLSAEDARLVEVMGQHPEYADLWSRLDAITEAEIVRDGVNPVLHVMIHHIVENQIADGDPPQTAETVRALMQKGLSRHEAIHRVGRVVSDEVFEILKDDRPFDATRYARSLSRLVDDV
jgi:hypothetical protein